MKRSIQVVLLGVLVAAFGCGTDTSTANQPLFNDGLNALQAQVFDGVTGAAITNATVTVQVGQATLTGSLTNGIYTVFGIPDGTFPITVTAAGYSTFQASLPALKGFGNCVNNSYSPSACNLSSGAAVVYTTQNIILYSTGVITAPITVSVAYANAIAGTKPVSAGDPVTNAPVIALFNGMTASFAGNVNKNLNPVPLQASNSTATTVVPATTNSEGIATIPATNLTYGGTYLILVLAAKDLNGDYLVMSQPTATNAPSVTAGINSQLASIFMDVPTAPTTVDALTVNNENTAVQVSNLQIKFPYPMVTCNPSPTQTAPTVQWNSTGTCTGIVPAVGNQPGTGSASITVDSDGISTLTVTPTYGAGSNITASCTLTFSNVYIQPAGTSVASCLPIGNLIYRLRGNGTVSAAITVHT